MIDYGSPPAGNEIEVTLFGPGYGEAVSVHLGEGKWMLIDSCIDPHSKSPASEVYLDNIGVSDDCVHTIVATHWHDDHVRGISRLAEKYSEANFVVSGVFNNADALAFLKAYNGESSSGLAKGAKELYSVINSRESVLFALHRMLVIDETINERAMKITALSPLHAAFGQCMAHFSQYLPKKGKSIKHAAELKTNLESIALHIDMGDDAILLGADLEDHGRFGWTAVVADGWSGSRLPASLYKVAHHGSISGDCDQVWGTLLEDKPVSCLTPWAVAGNRLPTDKDKFRLKGKSDSVYIASSASRRPNMGSSQLKRLNDIAKNVTLLDSGFGAVRMRKPITGGDWSVELFGSAQKV